MRYVMFATVLSVFLAMATTSASQEKPDDSSPPAETDKRPDVRGLLKAGDNAKSLPPYVVLRVQANLWGSRRADALERSDVEEKGIDAEKKLQETWEFTADHVHRVVIEAPQKSGDEFVYRREKSLPFDSKNLCKDLLDGKILKIAAREGMGEPVNFAGTDYIFGHRSIEILVDGESALQLSESCLFAGFAETDAYAFAALYERLASQARAAFQAKPAVSDPRGK